MGIWPLRRCRHKGPQKGYYIQALDAGVFRCAKCKKVVLVNVPRKMMSGKIDVVA